MGMGLETTLCPFWFSLKKENFCALVFHFWENGHRQHFLFGAPKDFAPPFFSFSFRRKKRIAAPGEEKKETTREPFGRFSGLSRSTKGASPLDSAAYGMSEVYDDDSERRCAERRDLSGGRDGRDGQMKAKIL